MSLSMMRMNYNYYTGDVNYTQAFTDDGGLWALGADQRTPTPLIEPKKSVYVKWEGKTIALGTFPAKEAADRCTRAKEMTQKWRMHHRPRPSKEWVIAELEKLGIRSVLPISKPKSVTAHENLSVNATEEKHSLIHSIDNLSEEPKSKKQRFETKTSPVADSAKHKSPPHQHHRQLPRMSIELFHSFQNDNNILDRRNSLTLSSDDRPSRRDSLALTSLAHIQRLGYPNIMSSQGYLSKIHPSSTTYPSLSNYLNDYGQNVTGGTIGSNLLRTKPTFSALQMALQNGSSVTSNYHIYQALLEHKIQLINEIGSIEEEIRQYEMHYGDQLARNIVAPDLAVNKLKIENKMSI